MEENENSGSTNVVEGVEEVEAPASLGGRFAPFAGTLSEDEADEMLQLLREEFGNIERDW